VAHGGPRIGLRRAEFEYEIAASDAEAMLGTLCDGPLVEKTRYLVPHDGLTWQVDVHEGALAGVVLAEIEQEHEDQFLKLPPWVGEVTGDLRFKNANLFKLHADPNALSIRTKDSV